MELEKQVVSLELSKKLKELGVKQESIHYWAKDRNGNVGVDISPFQTDFGSYSAFTVAELGSLLPARILSRKKRFLSDSDENHKKYEDDNFLEILWLSVGVVSASGEREGWMCGYGTDDGMVSHLDFREKNMADAMAKMLIYLIENKLV